MRKINHIIIHCSDSDISLGHTISDIDQWHKDRGFKRAVLTGSNTTHKHIGYHYVIEVDGTIKIGRGEGEIGAHCEGKNTDSLGICVIGKSDFNKQEVCALEGLVGRLRAKHPKALLSGHYRWSKKTCPNFIVKPLGKSLDTSTIKVRKT